ncbi:hypothetical protein pdam_00023714 [Pocillopora damicornis]|uniref:G-protein coupled receptors family 1 profile domain-containing protein n=1 Tax=Pocillopora damicornis TaxID=46731 RepID=A0A3M6UZ59_POCDA|nr:hypothetical protein pdam_00023714 [Pocillopora damicornis]
MTNTSSSSSTGVSRRNDTNDVYDGTQVEGIALCSALTLTFILVVVGNLLTIVIFAKNKNIRKKYLFLVVNMAFADLFLGALSLPVYIYHVGYEFHLWTTFVGNLWTDKTIVISYVIVDSAFSQASLISAVFITIAEFRRALSLCCTGRHLQAAVDTKLSKRRKERHRTTAEFSSEVAFEQDVMDTEFSRELAFEQNVMDTEFSRELAFEQDVLNTEFSSELAFEQDVMDTKL